MDLALDKLELRIPPVAAALLFAAAMWGASLAVPSITLPFAHRKLAATVLAVFGGGVSLAGVASFRRAKTTVDPTRPDAASALVSSGVYRVTRNPMYLGFTLMLLGWAALLSNVLSLIIAIAFVFYMNRFQIEPEERALSARFGKAFAAYRASVRRWV
jgi:protein-S-isoprenylcysteine O-methyltransferase Ste14